MLIGDFLEGRDGSPILILLLLDDVGAVSRAITFGDTFFEGDFFLTSLFAIDDGDLLPGLLREVPSALPIDFLLDVEPLEVLSFVVVVLVPLLPLFSKAFTICFTRPLLGFAEGETSERLPSCFSPGSLSSVFTMLVSSWLLFLLSLSFLLTSFGELFNATLSSASSKFDTLTLVSLPAGDVFGVALFTSDNLFFSATVCAASKS